jgi:branched-chain amino acid transport system substrate-binding protein
MSQSRRKALKGGLALLSGAALSAAGLPAAAADGEISIGFVGPVTGPFAELGTAMRDGALVAVEAVNKAGGVRVGNRTYNVKLVIGDEESTPERAVAATRRLIEVDRVVGILGYAISTNLLASMQLLQDSKIPMVDTSGRADSIPKQIADKRMDYLFQLSPTNRDFVDLHGELIRHYAKPKRIAILAFNTDFAREYAHQAEALWPKLMSGAEVKSFYVEASKMDLQPDLLQIRRFDPQVLWVLLSGTQSYQFVDQFAASGMIKRMVPLGDSIYGSELFRNKNGAKVDYHMANAITDRKPFTDLTLPFYDAFKAKTGNNPPYYAVQTYDGMLMILEALRRMQRVAGDIPADRTALRDALVSITDARPVKGARGTLAFAPLEKGRTVAVKPVIVQYQPNNQTTVIWPLDQAGKFMDPRGN